MELKEKQFLFTLTKFPVLYDCNFVFQLNTVWGINSKRMLPQWSIYIHFENIQACNKKHHSVYQNLLIHITCMNISSLLSQPTVCSISSLFTPRHTYSLLHNQSCPSNIHDIFFKLIIYSTHWVLHPATFSVITLSTHSASLRNKDILQITHFCIDIWELSVRLSAPRNTIYFKYKSHL